MPRMIDLGYTYNLEAPEASKPAKTRKEYPSCYVRNTALPIEPTDVGKTLIVQMQIHITGVEESTDASRGKSKEYRFEIRSMGLGTKRDDLKAAVKRAGRR